MDSCDNPMSNTSQTAMPMSLPTASPTALSAVPMPVPASLSAPGNLPGTLPGASYPPLAAQPTQEGPEGIRFDFNDGCRLVLPVRTSGKWLVRLHDLDSGNILFESENQGATINSSKRWYVRFRIEVMSIDEDATPARLVLSHDCDLTNRDVLIQFPIGTLGDTLAWFSYCDVFAKRHPGCRVSVAMSGLIIPLLRDSYPQLNLVTHAQALELKLAEQAYASYRIGLFFDDVANDHQPTDFRMVGLHRTAAYILGVDPKEEAPKLSLPDETRPIPEPYVCVAVQATSAAKYWNNPSGWLEVVKFLKANGYRVICIDQKPVNGQGITWNQIPHGVEDETGDRPLAERARWLRHADFFVGLSSGLAWLAWAARTPVVMISGFSHPTNEFDTPYRINNFHSCNGCWNDPKERFDHHDFLWCPRHAGTPRQFECTRLITASHVQRVIASIPSFGVHAKVPLKMVARTESDQRRLVGAR